MGGIPGGDPSDFSKRLQDAMSRVGASRPPDPPPLEMANDAGADPFNDRLAGALARVRGDAPADAPADEAPGASGGPVGQGAYVVRDGDCISSIAFDHGFYPDTLWDDSANSELREVRRNPNVLMRGDRVFIPEKRRRDESLTPETRHRFRRRGCPETLQIRFADEDDQPYASEAYVIEIDNETREGLTDGDGIVREPISPGADKVTISFPDRSESYDFQLGTLPPIESIEGVQKRLNNLGFFCGAPDGEADGRLRSALINYQRAFELQESGEPDEETRAHLQQRHGS